MTLLLNRFAILPAAAALVLVAVALAAGPPAQAQGVPCAAGGAVADPGANPGLVADCRTLLAARNNLAGGGGLNWSATLPIEKWDGVTLSGQDPEAGEDRPRRVVELDLESSGLSGEIPPELAGLAELRELYLHGNEFTGPVPSWIAVFPKLEVLYLSGNWLPGPVPSWIGGIATLQDLHLENNRLTGTIPPELGDLSELRHVHLEFNQLTGEIPPGWATSPTCWGSTSATTS